MSGMKVDILWSPNHEDKYVTFSNDLNLYKVDKVKDGTPKPQGKKIAEGVHASLLSTNSENQYMKCIAWYPKTGPDHLLAVGLTTGKVVLSSFGKESDPRGLIGKEFVPRHNRQCNCLAWNTVQDNLLAQGLDIKKNDNSLLIWDVHAKSVGSDFGYDRRSSQPIVETYKPIYEHGLSDATLSLAWFVHEPKTLVAGVNNKTLRIYDLREPSARSMTLTKAVNGVCIDLHAQYRMASFIDNQVTIWDTRYFERPVLTVAEQRSIAKLAWCPTRSGLLAVLPRESAFVKLYDIQNTAVGTDELEPALIERKVQSLPGDAISSFAWHHKHENRMLTITPRGIVRDIQIFERIALMWSPDKYLTWASGKQVLQYHSAMACKETTEDISVKMKRRAQKGYGVQKGDQWCNIPLVDDPNLKNLWRWLHFVTSLHDEGKLKFPGRGDIKYMGIKSVLKGDGSEPPQRSDLDFVAWQGIEGNKAKGQRKVFRSETRRKALYLCGWGQEGDNPSSNKTISRLQNEAEFEKAAAVALFHLRMRAAIDILQKGAKVRKEQGVEPNLSIVAMALSGFTDDKNTLWKEMCTTLNGQLTNPYLRSMFIFLTTDSEHYEDVLNESGMEVMDKVAFACLYLPDVKLLDYFEKLGKKLIESGNLNGILLTGLTLEGIDLLENYVDLTGDIQSASLITIQALPCDQISKDLRVQTWTEEYRNLLDRWKLWHQRAEFDVLRNSHDNTNGPQKQVFVCCHFCGKSIAYSTVSGRHSHFMLGGGSANKSKVTSCPACRKPLPRCALCLVNMGTAAGSGKHKKSNPHRSDEGEEKLSQFTDWFTWCQTCRHGGHANHMTEWFREHTECPVSGCTCACTGLDSMGRVVNDTLELSPTQAH